MANKKSAGKKKSAAAGAVKTKTAENTPAYKSEGGSAPVKAKSETKPDAVKTKGADGKKQAKKPGKAAKYFRDLRSEFKKVVWPSKKAVVNNTGVVLAVMLGSTLVMWGLDSGFAAILKGLLSLAGA